MERAETLTRNFREEMGLDAGYAAGGEARGLAGSEARSLSTRGLELEDVDGLLRRHEERSYHEGYSRGSDEMFQLQQRQRQVELGQYVGGAFSMVEREVLAAIVGAAAKIRDKRGSTKADIVQAVIDQVKREAAALNDMGHRARTGELFS